MKHFIAVLGGGFAMFVTAAMLQPALAQPADGQCQLIGGVYRCDRPAPYQYGPSPYQYQPDPQAYWRSDQSLEYWTSGPYRNNR